MPEDTLLEAVNHCHNHDPWCDPGFIKLIHDPYEERSIPSRNAIPSTRAQDSRTSVAGFVPHHILPALIKAGVVSTSGQDNASPGGHAVWIQAPSREGEEALFLHPSHLSYEERTQQMANVSEALRHSSELPFVSAGWRDELYTIYGPKSGQKLFSIERSVCSLFGFATFGVHATAFVRRPDGQLYFWVPRRSATKQTWPGMLDNTVAGGLSAGESQFDAMVRECEEEAGLPTELVRQRLTAVGTLSYFYLSGPGAGGTGLLQPEVQYLYDIELPSDIQPHPVDGEAEEFSLLSTSQVLEAIRAQKFKPNCSLVFIDFLLRHGILTAETEPDYALILPRLHADLGMATP